MFTGIGIPLYSTVNEVEHVGTVSSLLSLDTSESGGNGCSATITDVGPILEDVHLGDSISINGSHCLYNCLTQELVLQSLNTMGQSHLK